MGVPGNANALLLRSAAAAGGYQVSRSLRFNSADSAYLSRTPASAGNRKTYTFSCWVKKCKNASGDELTLLGGLSTANNNPRTNLYYDVSTDVLVFDSYNTSFDIQLKTNAVFRDNSAWAHVVLAVDTTQATSTNRVKLYVNNVEQTFGTTTYPSQNFDTHINAAAAQFIGSFRANTGYFNGYLADIWFLDGIAATPSDFAETDATTGQWIPKTYSGSKGSNGFHLEFADNSNNTASTLGKDTSGNGNNWTPNNLSVTAGAGNDSLVDTPTSYGTDTGAGGEVRGNYCTLNPLDMGSTYTLSNGNLYSNEGGGDQTVRGTIGMSSGKWYWEVTLANTKGNIGIAKGSASVANYLGSDANGWGYYSGDGKKYTNGAAGATYGATFTTNDVIGVAFDADNGTLTYYKNGTSQGTAFTGLTSGPYFPAQGTSLSQLNWNFGQRAWAYTPPANHKALVDTNLTSPVIAKPNTVMDVKLYTGNGGTNNITGLGFSPDLVWIKSRSSGTYWHELLDSVRGANKSLFSNATNAEETRTNRTLNSDGFTVVWGSADDNGVNANSATYAAWCFDAGTTTTTNTAGSIQSSTRVNATAGFSIVTYTGTGSNATVGHGLGVAPSLVITKNRASGTAGWYVYHKNLSGAGYVIYLNSTSAEVSDSTPWNSTAPTSTVFSVGTNSGTNGNGNNMVAYAFSPVAGYSSFGSYTGNGSSDGPFVYTGFRPKWIMIKRTDGAVNWTVLDSVRSTINPADDRLNPNTSGAETTNGDGRTDFLSNGFKLRLQDSAYGGAMNTSGGTYIYAAFAENPFQYARAR